MDEIYFHRTSPVGLDGSNDYTLREYSKKTTHSKTGAVLRFFPIAIALFLMGIGVGFWCCKLKKELVPRNRMHKTKHQISHEYIADQIDRKEIENNLRMFTKFPHHAGSKRNRKLAEIIRNKWQNEYGIKAKLIHYNVLLSFPSSTMASGMYLTSEGKVMFKTQRTEKRVEASEKQENVLPIFAAYSPSGNITGEIIYVNYGTIEDFQYLARHNITCKGKIVIVRYGENFRGDKVALAHDNGASGVIVYSDPADYAPVPGLETYPNGQYLPCTGVQRGSFNVGNGDPETPGYPSKDGIYRMATEKINLPKIPVYPISPCDAKEILRKLKKVIPRPDSWQGALNIPYNIGPGFEKPYDTWKARLEVYNEEKRENIYNVIGTIRGEYEPDRRVIIGNHRDAWVFGGVDPSGGTACLMEIARALGLAMKNGWRPRRTIMLSSWGGEEFGMIGSTEYVEEFSKTLREESVAYLNIDSPVRGTYSLFAKSSPMLFDVLFKSAKKVKNPMNVNETLYEQWLRNMPSTEKNSNLPRVDNIATGSDYVAFNQQLGIPSAEIRFIARKNYFGYPVYHSIHDTFNYVQKFMDQEFRIHRAIAQFMVHSLLILSDYKVLPMNASRYSPILKSAVKRLGEEHKRTLTKHNISLEYLEQAAEMFNSAVNDLNKKVDATNKLDVLKLRMLNDKILLLEKGFISDEGLLAKHQLKHVIFGLNAVNSYKTVEFPGLFNALTTKAEHEAIIEKQMNIVITHIRSVASYLADS